MTLRTLSVRWLISASVVGLTSACTSTTGFPGTFGPGGTMKADCTSPDDLCKVLTLAELNDICKASFSVPLRETEPFGVGSQEIGVVSRQCRYDNKPANGGEPWVTVNRECRGNGAAEAQQAMDQGRAATKETSTPQTVEEVGGIGDEAFYIINLDSETERLNLNSRQGNVLFGAEISNAQGATRDTMKACLASALKKVVAASPAK